MELDRAPDCEARAEPVALRLLADDELPDLLRLELDEPVWADPFLRGVRADD